VIQTHVLTPDGVEPHEDVADAKAATGTTWVRVSDGTPEEMQSVCDAFGIHDLQLEDVRQGVRPKVEEFDDHVFVLLKSARLRGGDTTFEEEISDQPIGVFLGEDWLVTLSTSTITSVGRVWEAVTREERRLLSRGPDFLAYRVLDAVVDEYFSLVDEVETDIERVEDEVVGATGIDTLEDINSLRRELLAIRRLLWPTRDALATVARGDVDVVSDDHEKYFRDVHDHVVQVVELVETYRDLVAGTRDIYLNSLSMSTNEVMKRLTVVATIILPLTFVVGVYGMNFENSAYNMPELQWTFGYPAVMLGMLGVTVVLVGYFRREGWL
jgi:magnesium transporter